MRLHPSRRAIDLSLVATVAIFTGILARTPDALLLGGGVLLGVAVSRAFSLTSVARARSAGFEMVWLTGARALPASRGVEQELALELRNRDDYPTAFRKLNITHAPGLEVSVFPTEGEVPAHGALLIRMRVRALRVGLHGIHGLVLRTIRAPGLFHVPLSFASPIVLRVLPGPISSRATIPLHRPLPRGIGPGEIRRPDADGSEFRELREHQAGDAFRKISWKASARRGRLLVVENETETPELVWILVDGSVESCSGPVGQAPLDGAIDAIHALIKRHLEAGDRVGLAVVGGRKLARVEPTRGLVSLAKFANLLAFETHSMDEDQSDWDTEQIRSRVLSHLRTIDARAERLSQKDGDGLLAHVIANESEAPTRPSEPYATTRLEQKLRTYLLSYGIQSPPSGILERPRAEEHLGELARTLATNRPRPSRLYLFADLPSFTTPKSFLEAISFVRRQKIEIVFCAFRDEELLLGTTAQEKLVSDALRVRQELGREVGAKEIRKRGAHLLLPRVLVARSDDTSAS